MTDDEIRKFILWLNTLSWPQLGDLAAYCLELAGEKREGNLENIRRTD